MYCDITAMESYCEALLESDILFFNGKKRLIQKQLPEVFFKKSCSKNFVIFAGKHLRLLLIKFRPEGQTYFH